MATPTEQNAERLRQLSERLVELAGKLEKHEEVTNRDLQSLQRELAEVASEAKRLREVVATTEVSAGRYDERLKAVEKAVEKGSDRRWQLAPILISAGGVLISAGGVVVAILIALSRK